MTPKCSIKGCKERPVRMSKCEEHWREYQAEISARSKSREKKRVETRNPSKTLEGKKSEIVPQKALKHLPRRKSNGDLALFRKLFEKWVVEERNFCMECGVWLTGEVWNMAHVIGDGECGGNEDAGKDEQNIVPMCRDHHTQMDNAVGKTRREMKCFPELERIRFEVATRHNLKVRKT